MEAVWQLGAPTGKEIRESLGPGSHYKTVLTVATTFAAQNPTLARFVIALQNVATRFWIWQMEKQSPESQLEDVGLHRGLGQAIADGDPDLAEALCAQLIGHHRAARPAEGLPKDSAFSVARPRLARPGPPSIGVTVRDARSSHGT